jgi:RNA polymerase sigma factor (sigma-70 family)
MNHPTREEETRKEFFPMISGHLGRLYDDWLTDLADKQLQREVKRLAAERRTTVSIDQDIPELPPEEAVLTLGEEVLDLYQPDEDLKLEDIFPDTDVSSPEDIGSAKQDLLRCINAALAGMPREWRRALRLRYAKGLTGKELSETIKKDVPAIEQLLDYARQHLRQSLFESGCTFMARDGSTRKGKPDGR